MAASNNTGFARDNYIVSTDKRKCEIAHTPSTNYLFYGKEKEIRIQIHPSLTELVKYTMEVQESPVLEKINFDKQKNYFSQFSFLVDTSLKSIY